MLCVEKFLFLDGCSPGRCCRAAAGAGWSAWSTARLDGRSPVPCCPRDWTAARVAGRSPAPTPFLSLASAAKIRMRGDRVRMGGNAIFFGRIFFQHCERGGSGSIHSFFLDGAATEKCSGVHLALCDPHPNTVKNVAAPFHPTLCIQPNTPLALLEQPIR
jgi:hypothetical protein